MKILVRADNPGGRGRFITVLQNRGLIVNGAPVYGLRIDEIGEIQISPGVLDPAYHANLWIVEPLLSQIKRAIQPGEDEDEANSLFDAMKTGTHNLATVINGIKRPEGYTTATNVTFMLPRFVATPRRIWA